MNGTKLTKAAGILAAFGALSGLALARCWAVLGGRLPGKVIGVLALALAALCLFLVLRLELVDRVFTPWPRGTLKNLLVAAPAFVLGGWFDLSFSMFDPTGLLVGGAFFRGLSGLGSGLVLSCIVLALVKAARDFGGLDAKGVGGQMLLLALLVNVAALLYCGGSATVYTWDNAGYWTIATGLAQAPFGLDQLREVLASTITLDYNYLLALPISWLMRLLGTGREVFVFAIANLYLLPGLLGLCVLTRGRKYGGLLLALLTPMLTYLALLGYVDVAAASAAIWAFALYTRWEKPELSRGILAGALLAASFLLRRYFLFFAVSFGVGAMLSNLITNRRKWVGFVALFSSCGVFALFFTQSFLVDKILSVKYGDIYSAYDLGLRSDVMLFCRYFGLVILVLTLFLGILALVRRRDLRPTMVLALGQLVLCFFLLTRVQSHGQQHLLLYLPAIATILATLPAAGKGVYGSWILAGATTFCTLLPLPQPGSIGEIRSPAPLPSFTFSPPRRGDITQVLALRSFVDGLSAAGGKTVAVVSSSFLLNGETFTNAYSSLGLPPGDGPHTDLIYMCTVDKRDPFSWNSLKADYLIVPDPVQTHLGEENQQIMALVAHDVLEGTGLGNAYRRLETSFQLDGGVAVYVYERTREITEEERQGLSRRLVDRYPEYAALYAAP